jgi:hypothetical protein
MQKAINGSGTILHFASTPDGYVLIFRTATIDQLIRHVTPEVAQALADTYGTRDQRNPEMYSTKALNGSAMTYRESAIGIITEVKILLN